MGCQYPSTRASIAKKGFSTRSENVAELVAAQARKALEQLRSFGWAVGPSVARDDWRRAVRAEARRRTAPDQAGGTRGRE
jgi:hypothetical protein